MPERSIEVPQRPIPPDHGSIEGDDRLATDRAEASSSSPASDSSESDAELADAVQVSVLAPDGDETDVSNQGAGFIAFASDVHFESKVELESLELHHKLQLFLD